MQDPEAVLEEKVSFDVGNFAACSHESNRDRQPQLYALADI